VKIKIEKTGGITGIPTSYDINTDDLPPSLITKAKRIIENGQSNSLTGKAPPAGSADHLNYKITLQDGLKKRVIECNQYNIQGELKSLISYVEKNLKKSGVI
jgi:hypothetical protein